jgi:hypothetical protein
LYLFSLIGVILCCRYSLLLSVKLSISFSLLVVRCISFTSPSTMLKQASSFRIFKGIACLYNGVYVCMLPSLSDNFMNESSSKCNFYCSFYFLGFFFFYSTLSRSVLNLGDFFFVLKRSLRVECVFLKLSHDASNRSLVLYSNSTFVLFDGGGNISSFFEFVF